MIVYRQNKPRLGGHERMTPVKRQRSGTPSALGREIVEHFKVQAARRRAERAERVAAVMAERLREIQNAQQPRKAKDKR